MDTQRSKFILYGLDGTPRAFYTVTADSLSRPGKTVREPRPAHLILVLDRSGSMWGAMEELKANLRKLLTLEEYQNPQLLVSVFSYSSQGDMTAHLTRVLVTEVMKPKSKYLAALDKLQPTGATCISQGLAAGLELVREGEITVVALMTDGQANDPSYFAEQRALEGLAARLTKNAASASLSTIAYGSWADHRLLTRLANTGGGAYVQAKTVREIFDALVEVRKRLAETEPAMLFEKDRADYQVFVSRSAGRILGGEGDLRVSGLAPLDDKTLFRYQRLPEMAWRASDLPQSQNQDAVYALSRAWLAEGQLTRAKQALGSTTDRGMARHLTALTQEQLAEMTSALDEAIFNPESRMGACFAPIEPAKSSVLEVLALLSEHRGEVLIDMDHLQANYKRRGVKKLTGKWVDGKLEVPKTDTAPKNKAQYMPLNAIELNRSSATVNLRIATPVNLVDRATRTPILEVAGVRLDDLSDFRNYTLVGDGALNVERLRARILDPILTSHLAALGIVSQAGEESVELDLTRLPLVREPEGVDVALLATTFSRLCELKTVASFLKATMGEESSRFTPEQLTALKEVGLSKSLYPNFPQTTPYPPGTRAAALAKGEIDTRASFRVGLGSTSILSLEDLRSANELLGRFYEAYDPETKAALAEKPTMAGTAPLRPKDTKKLKPSAVDALQKPLLDAWVKSDYSQESPLGRVFGSLGLTATDVFVPLSGDAEQDMQAKTEEALELVSARIEMLYRTVVIPLAFYVGATGSLPDSLPAKMMTADELSAKYPELKPGKAERDGLFFDLGSDTILSLYAETVDFSPRES